jgi:hypothetical protein
LSGTITVWVAWSFFVAKKGVKFSKNIPVIIRDVETGERVSSSERPQKKKMDKALKEFKEQGITDQQAVRFAHAYVSLCDPTKAAMSVGIGRTSGTWNEDKAVAAGEFLVNHPIVRSHIAYLNSRVSHKLSVSLEQFNALLAEMLHITFDDYFMWDEEVDDYVVKPFHYLTKAELMCLSDVTQYQRLVKLTREDGAESVSAITLKMVDKLKLLHMYAELNGFYGRAGGASLEELQRKLREAMVSVESTDGG